MSRRTHRLADLRLGTQLAWRGARARTLLTAIGLGLATAVLLLAASLPPAAANRSERLNARGAYNAQVERANDATMVVAQLATDWHGRSIGGYALQPDGTRPPIPPGLTRVPKPGELFVSPALAKVLREPGAEQLAQRLGGRVVGEIAPSGLGGARELYVYTATDRIPEPGTAETNGAFVARIAKFGDPQQNGDPLSDAALFLAIIGTIVLLIPVGVLVSTAARFGGERRDRRLAALRLIGGSGKRVAWISAGESLAGAVLGLVVGAMVFFIGRQLAQWVSAFGWTVFPADVRPDPLLLALVVVGVPLTATVTTLLAMRRVIVEPLSVTRRTRSTRGRLWWRIALIVVGFGLLAEPAIHPTEGGMNLSAVRLSAAVLALFFGAALMLPWLVEVVARRLPAWSVPSQLALRSLRAEPGGAARIAAGLALAIAGAITLQTLLTQERDEAPAQASSRGGHYTALDINGSGDTASALAAQLRGIDGVRRVSVVRQFNLVGHGQSDGMTPMLTVGTCADLTALAPKLRCEAGTVVPIRPAPQPADPRRGIPASTFDREHTAVPEAGERVKYRAGYGVGPWTRTTVPDTAAEQPGVDAPNDGMPPTPGLLAAAGAIPDAPGDTAIRGIVWLEPGASDAALEAVRDAAAERDLLARVYEPWTVQNEDDLADVRRAILLGSALLLLLLSVSLVVISFEQVAAQRRTLATLSATGVPAATLRAALWLRALVPTAIGLGIATVAGLGLGFLLLRIQSLPIRVDLPGLLQVLAVGGVLSMLATACVLPVLRRATAPGAMRTE